MYMAMQNWKSLLMPYEQAVEELKVKLKSIRKEYRKRNEYSPIEFVTGRVKEVSSLLEKANKFEIPLDRVGEEMEDIAGIRIMCQFVDDIDTVIELIRARKDMQILYEKDYVRLNQVLSEVFIRFEDDVSLYLYADLLPVWD